jgi:hypothetical protein
MSIPQATSDQAIDCIVTDIGIPQLQLTIAVDQIPTPDEANIVTFEPLGAIN